MTWSASYSGSSLETMRMMSYVPSVVIVRVPHVEGKANAIASNRYDDCQCASQVFALKRTRMRTNNLTKEIRS